jgi:bromodomain and WD repeat domain-containing protein 1/3
LLFLDERRPGRPSSKQVMLETTNETSSKKAKQAAKANRKIELSKVTECPPEYRPPEWLTSTKPNKSPYAPQMGDEVVYFRQGHELYVNRVRDHGLYELDESSLPWSKGQTIQVQEFCRVIGMKIEIRPPRLVCLKLGVMDRQTGSLTGTKFSIKYHDVDNVPDFVILKQFYERAMEKNWRAKDRFRCVIDNSWYFGTILSRQPYQVEYPDSQFQCLNIEWEDGGVDQLSPWDLEPISGGINARKSKPVFSGDQLPSSGELLTAEELKALLYTPQETSGSVEWPEHGRDVECLRILEGLDKIMTLSLAENFNFPVDLEAFPSYAMVIPYPIDLQTIRQRVENHYYRRLNSIQWDIRKIEWNAEHFNEKGSDIVRQV